MQGPFFKPSMKQILQKLSSFWPFSYFLFWSAHFSFKQGTQSFSFMKPKQLWPHLSFLVQASFNLFMQSSLVQTSSKLLLLLGFLPNCIGYSQYRHFLWITKGLLLGFRNFMLFASLSQVKWGNLTGFALLSLASWTQESKVSEILFVKVIERFSILATESICYFSFDELKLLFARDASY